MSKESRNDEHSSSSVDGVGGMNTGVAIVGFILCFISGAGLMWGYDSHRLKKGEIGADSTTASAAGGNWSDEDSPIPVSSKDPTWGKRDAPVTIVIFSDFQCPFCSRGEATIDQVKTTYGDKIRVVWKNEPLSFHPNAKPAAEAAQGVFALKGAEAFWKFHDLAFKNQQTLSEENYLAWAGQAGVTDMAKFKAGLAAHTWADKVEKDHAIAQKSGVNGTPAFFINGSLLSGAQPFDKFKTVIDQELQKATAKIAGGTPKDKVYVAMSSENKKAAPAAPKEEEEGEKEDTKTVFKVPVGQSPVLGSPNALVTIVEFSDFQCPYCKRTEEQLKKIRDTYGDKVRFVWKEEPLPFHPRAEPAAELGRAARAEKGDKGWWAAHDAMFDSQPKLDDADLEAVAVKIGIDKGKAMDAIKTHKYKKEIDADSELADDLQASGTPHFFINGRRLVGAQPFEKFQKIIDEEIKHAQDVLAKGVSPAKLYEELVKDGKGAPEPEKKAVPPGTNSPAKGNTKSKIIIQEFSDFQCPFCSRAEDVINQVMKEYGDRVQLQWRNLPLPMHADAPLAAQAAQEAYKQKGADAFWKMHDKLYAGQKGDGLKRPAIEGYAQELGLNMDKFKTSLDTSSHKAEIEADEKAAKDAGISGTPAFVINGYYISGAQPFPKFKKLIERAIAEQK